MTYLLHGEEVERGATCGQYVHDHNLCWSAYREYAMVDYNPLEGRLEARGIWLPCTLVREEVI